MSWFVDNPIITAAIITAVAGISVAIINKIRSNKKRRENSYVSIENNYGLTVKDVFELSMLLFDENFPKLQQIACDTAERRVDQLMKEVFHKLSENDYRNYESFTDPDTQYVLFEAQKNYARIGDDALKDLLVSLIYDRVNCEKSLLCVALNEAIIATSKILPKHYDHITLLFILHRTQHGEDEFRTIEDVKRDIEDSILPFINEKISYHDSLQMLSAGVANKRDIPYGLDSLLRMKYGSIVTGYSFKDFVLLVPELYKLSSFNENALLGLIELTNSGVAIALSNYNIKTNKHLSISKWIR